MKSFFLYVLLFLSLTVSGQQYIADYTIAKQEVLRQIPTEYIYLARKNLRVAYQHTSHGTHVSHGLFGLPDFKAGDDTLFAISYSATDTALEFHDFALSSYAEPGVDAADLSRDETAFIQTSRNYLDDPDNSEINVIMWSWCNIADHDVSGNYLPGMDSLINEYGPGGSKIGSGPGQRENPVTFIYMTGHGNANSNIGDGKPKNQADQINAACNSNQQFCLDYFSIDAHDMADNYWDDAGDNGQSSAYGGNFYHDYEDTCTPGIQYYYNRNAIGGDIAYGDHNDQHITANRKAYAMWWILARIAGWDGLLDSEQDTEVPSVPQNLQALTVGNTTIELSWEASTDNIAVAYYEIYRADVKVGETVSLSFEDTGLEPATTYIYSVVAVDSNENRSDASTSLPVLTTDEFIDEEAPTVPSGLVAEGVSTSQINLSWEASTDNIAVAYYEIYRTNVKVGETVSLSFEDTGLEPATTYIYSVVAVDNSGNRSDASTSLPVITSDVFVDEEVPTVPSGLVAEGVSTSQINLSWEASTDNDAVKNYKVFRDDVEIAQPTNTTYEDTGLEAGTVYEYEVSAVDNSDNESALCTPASASTLDLNVSIQSQKDDIQSEITSFPSPTSGVVNIRFSIDKPENIEIIIVNILGKVIRRVTIDNPATGEHTIEFDISNQPRGLYIYQVRTYNGLSAGKVELLN